MLWNQGPSASARRRISSLWVRSIAFIVASNSFKSPAGAARLMPRTPCHLSVHVVQTLSSAARGPAERHPGAGSGIALGVSRLGEEPDGRTVAMERADIDVGYASLHPDCVPAL